MVSEIVDRLNNVLTGIAVKSGVLESKVLDENLTADLHELAELANEAVLLLRQLVAAE